MNTVIRGELHSTTLTAQIADMSGVLSAVNGIGDDVDDIREDLDGVLEIVPDIEKMIDTVPTLAPLAYVDHYWEMKSTNIVGISWSKGTVDKTDGSSVSTNTWLRTGLFRVKASNNNPIAISVSEGYRFNVMHYTTNKLSSWDNTLKDSADAHPLLIMYPSGYYVVTIQRLDKAAMTATSEFYSNCSIGQRASSFKDALARVASPSRMQFGAHRGAEYWAPQNSPLAYKLAGQMGFGWAWLAAIRVSSDGELIVCHDETLEAMTGDTRKVADVPYYGTGGIASMQLTVQPTTVNYVISELYEEYTQDDLKIPTLEEVVRICVRYGMKMCFRLGGMPTAVTGSENDPWQKFKAILNAYNVPLSDCVFSFTTVKGQVEAAKSVFGSDIEYSLYIKNATASQIVASITGANRIEGLTNLSTIIHYDVLDQDEVKYLHSNGLKVYAYSDAYKTVSDTAIRNCAEWGVDIFQNPYRAYVP